MTGVAALYGDDITRAAKIAAARVNRNGGVTGRQLELVVADDASAPDVAVEAGRRLVRESGCVALIGNLMSNVRLDVVESVADPLGIPLLNFSFYEGSISSPWFFNFAALPNQQIELMIPYMAERIGPRMYFAGNNYEWPRGSISAATDVLRRIDGEVVGEEFLPLGLDMAECDALLERVASAGPDVFIPYFAGEDQVLVLTRLHALGLHDRAAVLTGHFDEVMARELSPDARNGLYAANSYFMTVQTPANDELLADVASSEGITGIWPEGNGVVSHFAEGAYACVTAFAQAAQRATALHPASLVTELERVSIDVPQGRVLMDPATHHAHVNGYLCRCDRDGRFHVLESFGRTPPRIPERYHDESAHQARRPTAAQRTRAGRRRLRAAAMRKSDVALLVCDNRACIAEANTEAAKLFGYDGPGELVGRSAESLVPPHLREVHRAAVHRFLQTGAERLQMTDQRQIYGYRKDGTYFPMSATVSRMTVDGEMLFTVSLRDVSTRNTVESKLRHAATHDELTGLANRACITDRLGRSLHRASRSAELVGVLVIDLDSFKSVNDTHGHEAGDHVLRRVATRLTQSIRPGDAVARLAGDEFLVVAERLRQPEDLAHLAQRIVVNLEAPIDWGGTMIRVSASLGLAVSEGDAGVQRLINQADLAMTNVKDRHPGDWEFYSAALHESAQRRQQLSQHVRTAVDNGELYPHFQPIVRLSDSRIVGAEILTRWNSRMGPVSPAEFIPIAESTGAILGLGTWVIEQACEAQAAWERMWSALAPRVFINVSPRQLTEPGFLSGVLRAAQQAGTDVGRIVCELTESGLMADFADAKAVVQDLVDHGIEVAVDDFGTGYSSLAELTQLPVNLVKIDRSFIASAGDSGRSTQVLQAIVDLGRALRMATLAEGVETAAQAELVRRFGCDYAQGFYFGTPMSRDEFEDAMSYQLSTAATAGPAVPATRRADRKPATLRALEDAS